MMISHEDKTTTTSSRRSGSTRASTRKSHRSSSSRKSSSGRSKGSRSPNRSEPRRSKRSKEDLEAKEKARAKRDNGYNDAAELAAAVDHTGAVEAAGPSSSRNKPRKSNRRSQQDKGVAKDATAKAKGLINRSNEANSGPAPGAHADSRGDEVAKDQNQKCGKGRFGRPLGTQSVYTMEERVRMESEKGHEQGGLLVANAVDESHDRDLAMALLNSMLDQQMVESDNTNPTKNTKSTPDKTKSKDEENEESSDGKDWESSKRNKAARLFRLLCCIIVLGAAGIGSWIALRDNNNSISDTKEPSSSGGVPNVTTDTDTVQSNSTEDPISTPNPNSPNATSAPSGSLGSNTGADLVFEPPSEEDCAAISNGGAIQGQDTMPIQSYLLDLDATPFLPMDLSISAGMIEDKLRELLTLALTGCDREVRKLRNHHRHLAGNLSYAIRNVMVDAFGVEGVPCLNISNQQCHRVSVTLDVVVKDESVKVATVITELSLFFGVEGLVNNLELAALYQSMKVANLGSIDTTNSPSTPLGSTDQTKSPSNLNSDTSPSMIPSPKVPSAASSRPTLVEAPVFTASPTGRPTSGSRTSAPTSAPSVVQETTLSPTSTSLPPTPGPTRPPTPQPSGSQGTPPTSPPPTSRPTPFPTPRPTPFPTSRPVALPTFSPPPTSRPTPFPTPRPTPFPTFRPVALPAFMPVADPTPAPSTSPSEVPSTSPTNVLVVESPSTKPSIRPSFGESSHPSTLPSTEPSTAPSLQPSSTPSIDIESSVPSNGPSATPSAMQSSDSPRCDYLRGLLENHAPLSTEAMEWLCNRDTWEPPLGTNNPDSLWIDRYVIAVLYYQTDGDNWGNVNWDETNEWISSTSVCTWFEIECSSSGNVVSVDLRNSNIIGSISSEIGLLADLTFFRFNGKLSGTIPTELGNLAALTKLQITYSAYLGAGITGTIPTELGRLLGLEYLDLQGNLLTETIPPLPASLKYINVYWNRLTGTIPTQLFELRGLTSLDLTWNAFTGTIPTDLGNLDKLRSLRLFANRLNGSIPSEIIKLTDLGSLFINENMFTGVIPPLPPSLDGSLNCAIALQWRWSPQLEENCFSNVDNVFSSCRDMSANCSAGP